MDILYFSPKLNKYKGNIKIVLTYSNSWLEISGLRWLPTVLTVCTHEGG